MQLDNFSREDKQELLNTLVDIASSKVKFTDTGICGNSYIYAELPQWVISDILKEMFAYWPDCHKLLGVTADVRHPVGGYMEFKNGYANDTLWDNPRRTELLDWLILNLATHLYDTSPKGRWNNFWKKFKWGTLTQLS